MSQSSPPRKTNFLDRRDRQFLYLHEIDALIAATRQTRAPIRNQALVMLLFCQALQPSEICWLRWCDLNSITHTLLIVRNRSKSLRLQPQVVVNQQPLSLAEIEILQELVQQSKTDWILESERLQRLSDRSLHHIVYQAGIVAGLPIPSSLYAPSLWAILPRRLVAAICQLVAARMLPAVELLRHILSYACFCTT